jgi:hypothetical protein
MQKVVFTCLLMFFVLSGFAYAKVSGTCSSCHTMHNSQNADGMVLDSIAPGTDPNCTTCHNEPRAVLLRMNCLGCHGQDPAGASNIIPLDNVPQVAHKASTDLAAGNYRYVFQSDPQGDDSHGHNVHGFSDISDDSHMVQANYPPGYRSDYDPSPGYQTGSAYRIMCAGRNGCHGNRDYAGQLQAIKGAHHADDSLLKFGADFTDIGQGDTVGKSYRFLYKVHGAEDSDWQATLSATDHNEYKGSIYGSSHSSPQTWNTIDTISEFCAECHGDFHLGGGSGIGSASPWLRHPTDIVLPDTGEYSAYTAYSTEAPVARQNINGTGGASGTITPGEDIVMCLSCHRAHASQYLDILRWDYSTMVAGGGGSGGCFTCHTQKKNM